MGGIVPNASAATEPRAMPVKLEDFGDLQARYLGLPLAKRAEAVLYDAEPALMAAEEILAKLSDSKPVTAAVSNIRKSSPLIGKLRPSEAKNILTDSSTDFIESTRRKLAAWRKTMERLSAGEGITSSGGKEFLPGDSAIALAIMGNSSVSSYLSIIQIVLGEAVRVDGKNASHYAKTTAQVRRCSTVLSDCEIASDIAKSIL